MSENKMSIFWKSGKDQKQSKYKFIKIKKKKIKYKDESFKLDKSFRTL